MNYRVHLKTCYKRMRPFHTETNLYTIIDRIYEMREEKYDQWMDTDEIYEVWSGHPFKITDVKFDRDGKLLEVEMTEY